MKIPIYQVDAFTDHLFGGNPAAVCPLVNWLPDDLMQNIANENNLAETAFFISENGHFHIRWFTPVVEVALCGHATLASGHVLYEHLNFTGQEIRFRSRSGWLNVKKEAESITLDFPSDPIVPAIAPDELIHSLGITPLETYHGKTDWMFVTDNQKTVEHLNPDFGLLAKIPGRGVIVTAKGDNVDFVSRFFAPQSGVPEDPVTGSAHTTLAPFWGKRLGKQELKAMQVSRRQGHLLCRLNGDRVEISGNAHTYLVGEVTL